MSHPIFRVISFEQTGVYSLRLGFDDGLFRTIDFEPILAGELFGPLRDPKVSHRRSSMPKSTPLFGHQERTSIRLHCITGPIMSPLLKRQPGGGATQ
jgi:hypothetical protein